MNGRRSGFRLGCGYPPPPGDFVLDDQSELQRAVLQRRPPKPLGGAQQPVGRDCRIDEQKRGAMVGRFARAPSSQPEQVRRRVGVIVLAWPALPFAAE